MATDHRNNFIPDPHLNVINEAVQINESDNPYYAHWSELENPSTGQTYFASSDVSPVSNVPGSPGYKKYWASAHETEMTDSARAGLPNSGGPGFHARVGEIAMGLYSNPRRAQLASIAMVNRHARTGDFGVPQSVIRDRRRDRRAAEDRAAGIDPVIRISKEMGY